MRESAVPDEPGRLIRTLLQLYPRAWRARYGEELAATVAPQPVSVSLVIDMIAGAIDARLNPALVSRVAARPAAAQQGEEPMIGKMLKLRCMGYGPEVSSQDQWKAVGVMLGLTVVFTLVWMWAHVKTGDNPYLDSLGAMPFLAAYLFSMPFTYLKGRSRSAQFVFIAGSLLIVTVVSLAAGFIAARI